MRVVVGFASQTGNAESIATLLTSRLAKITGLEVESTAKSVNELVSTQLADGAAKEPCCLLLVCSTCGDGDFPDNASKVKRWAKKLGADSLRHISFAVLALGSTDYSNFCMAGRNLRGFFVQAGATEIQDIGLADDATSLETVVTPWIDNVVNSLCNPTVASGKSAPSPSADVYLLHGSDNGAAQSICESLRDSAQAVGLRTSVMSLNEAVSADLFSREALRTVIVCGSGTNGDCPENAAKFWKFLRRPHQAAALHNVTFAVLGVGDSQHAGFGVMVRQMDAALAAAGARRFHRRGEVDENLGVEDAVAAWSQSLWGTLQDGTSDAADTTLFQATRKEREELPIVIFYGASPAGAQLAAVIQRLMVELRTTPPTMWPANMVAHYPDSFPRAARFVMVGATTSEVCDWAASLARYGLAAGSSVDLFPHDTAAVILIQQAGGELIDSRARDAAGSLQDWVAALLAQLAAMPAESIRDAVNRGFGLDIVKPQAAPVATRGPEPRSLDALKPVVFVHSAGRITEKIASELHQSALQRHVSHAMVDVQFYRHVGFPRRAVFVFIVGESESAGIRSLLTEAKHAVSKYERHEMERKTHAAAPLADVRFALLAIGDRNGKLALPLEVESILLAGGAMKVHPTGLCGKWPDDSDGVVLPWVEQLWAALDSQQSVATEYFDQPCASAVQWEREAVPLDPKIIPHVPVDVFYTDRGRARAMARFVHSVAEAHGFTATVARLRSPGELEDTVTAIICGDVPKHFTRNILTPDALSDLRFAVLLVGKDAEQAQRATQGLTHFGATPLQAPLSIVGLGQLENVVVPWTRRVLAAATAFTRYAQHVPNSTLAVPTSDVSRLVVLHCGSPIAESIARDLWTSAGHSGIDARVGRIRNYEEMGFGAATHVCLVYHCTSESMPVDALRLHRYVTSEALPYNHFHGLQLAVARVDGRGEEQLAPAFLRLGAGKMGESAELQLQSVTEDNVSSWITTVLTACGARGLTDARAPGFPPSPPAAPAHEQHRLLVLYGSATGHAERIARAVALAAQQRGHSTVVSTLNEFDSIAWKRCRALIVVASTAAEGTLPENAAVFSRFLRQRSHPRDVLSGLRYCVLAIGDSYYGARFCAAGRYIDRRLEELGAMRFYARADADERFGYNATVEPWLQNLWSAIDVTPGPMPLDLTNRADSDALGEDHDSTTRSTSAAGDDGDSAFTASLKSWDILANDPLRPVVHLKFGVANVQWSPGDAVSVWPVNREKECDELARRLGVDPRETFAVTGDGLGPAPIYRRLQFPITYREVLMRNVCLRVRNSNVLSVMLTHTPDAAGKEVVKRWMQRGAEWMQIIKSRTYIGELLDKVPGCRPPFQEMIEALMPLQPRFYSVCSAHAARPDELAICFRKATRGVCTDWLLRLCQAQAAGQPIELRIALRRGAEFRLPDELSTPLVLIGPGTGVAPFISFLQHRQHESKRRGVPCGETHLFFGCRMKDLDFLFETELAAFREAGALHGLHVAFSQEPRDGVWYGGCYVQDKLLECSGHLAHLIVNQRGYVYVCGDADSMAHDVHNILVDTVEEHCKVGRSSATAYLDEMAAVGRYQRDIWS
jgi:sulfite reductase alpha subunit-like flavoprotein